MTRAFAAVSVAVLLAVPSIARADAAGCTKTLGKAVRSYVKSRQKAIAGCENKRSKGKLDPSTICRPQCSSGADDPGAPCRNDADCPMGTCQAVTDSSTDKKLTSATTKATTKITADCGTPPPLGPACDSAVDATTLAACVTAAIQDADNNTLNADTLMRTVYGTTAPVDATLVKCQAAIGKEVGKYLNKRVKTEIKCGERLAGVKIAGPCPDADTAAALDTARAKLDAGIRKKCTEAQLAASSPPNLDFGRPCELYKLVVYERGAMSANSIPVLDRFIGCIADATAGAADRTVDTAYPARETSAFTLGVAAGDATDTSAIFWTKLPDSTMGAQLDIATDTGFTTGLQTIGVSSPSGADGVVKEDVGSLVAHTTYYYRFRQGTETSAVGRVTTAPSPSDATTVVRLGWSGDSNAFYRPYNSLDPIRLLAPDGWFYIGDTIYGDDAAADGVVAMTQPEYEAKYQLNRADASLRHMIESTGTYAQWDDHEVRNDFAGAEPVFATRMAAGNAAFRRYMPLREDGGDPMQLYRNFRFGTGAEFFLIDDRQYRTAKYTCCSNAMESGFVTTDDDTTCHMSSEALTPSASCTTAMSGMSRSILGATQKTWLENGLLNSTATFKFIMNGPPMTQLLFLPYDRWEAWIAERNEILNFIQTNAIPNVVWVSTDLHAVVYSPTHLNADNLAQPGTELVVGAIGETTLFRELPPSVAGLLGVVPTLLKQASHYDIDRYNTVLITVDPGAATAQFDIYDRTGAIMKTVTLP